MARYIDADAYKQKLEDKDIFFPALYSNELNETPTADVAEVKHGEWIKQNGIYVCSECGYTLPYDVVGDVIEYWECLYCRHCGAKMDGTPKERGAE